MSIGRALKKEGYSITNAHNARAAMELLKDATYHLVITDITMPGLSGLDLLDWIKATPATQQVPVIVISSNRDEHSRLSALEAGATAYLEKPITPFELLIKVRQVIG